MTYPSPAQKVPRNTARVSDQRASAGPLGIAMSPPAYGIDLVDREAAPEPDRVHQALDVSHAVAADRHATRLQRKAIIPPSVESPVKSTTEATPTPAPSAYTVKTGETLPIIAALLTSDASRWTELQEANPQVGVPKPGQILILPASWIGQFTVGSGSIGIVGAALEWLSAMLSAAPSAAGTAGKGMDTTNAAAATPAHGDPLALALTKVGQVAYKNENFLPGSCS